MSNGADRRDTDPVAKQKARNVRGRQKALGKRARDRADKVIGYIRAGDTVETATAKVNCSRSAYLQWRKINDMGDGRKFKDEVERARAQRSGKRTPCPPFGKAFRKKYFRFETYRHHQDMIDFINGIGPGEIGLIMLPPEHSKTTFMEDFVCHQIADDPNIRVLYVSKSQKHAKKVLGRVQTRMTDRNIAPQFISDFGPFRGEGRTGKPWTSTHFTVEQSDAGERDFTMEAVGINGQIYGARTDLMILDDVADTENQSEAMIEDQMEWIEQTVLSRIGRKGRCIFVGTRVKDVDIYSTLLEQDFFDHVMKRKALLREPGTNGPDDPGESLWPEWWPPGDLIKLRRNKMKPERWELVFQQEDQSVTGKDFPKPVVEACFNNLFRIGEFIAGCVNVAGFDPGVSGYSAIVGLAVNRRNKLRHVLDVWNEAGLVGDGGDVQAGLIQFLVSFCDTYNIRYLVMEENSAFRLLSSSLELRQKLAALGVRIIRVKSGKNENDDMAIKLELPPLFFNQTIILPAKGPSRQRLAPFVNQLSKWVPGDKKLTRDMVKALQFAERGAREVIGNTGEKPKVNMRRKLTPHQAKIAKQLSAAASR